MSNPTHISKHVNNWFKARFFDHLMHKYKAKTLDDIHIKMLSELEQYRYEKKFVIDKSVHFLINDCEGLKCIVAVSPK